MNTHLLFVDRPALTGDAETLKLIKAAAKSAVRSEIEAIRREQLEPERMEVEAEVEPEAEMEVEPEKPEELAGRLRGRRPALIQDEETLAAIRLPTRKNLLEQRDHSINDVTLIGGKV